PLERPVNVRAGDRMRTRMTVRCVLNDWIYRWDTTITGSSGERIANFKQTNFRMLPGESDHLLKSEANFRPILDESGQVRQAILERMDGRHSLSEIAHELLTRFPDKFRTVSSALAEVADCSRRYGLTADTGRDQATSRR